MSVLAQAASAQGSAEAFVFWPLAVVALGSAISMVVMRSAVHAALMLVINFFCIAALYAVLEAQFLAAVQIIVYAGAIMVLFLFVIMLLGVARDQTITGHIPGQRPAALVLGLVLLVTLVVGVAGPYLGPESACNAAPAGEDAGAQACVGLAEANRRGNVQAVGVPLFTDYMWPFEVTSVLLVIAALGAMVLGRKTEDPRDLTDFPDVTAAEDTRAPTRPSALHPGRQASSDAGGES